MYRLSEEIQKLYFEGLKNYIVRADEEYLTHAYEMGRDAAQKGVSELDIVTYHHDKLVELNEMVVNLDYEVKIQRASDYLKECLALFEVKLGSYRNVIEELKAKNEQLNEEIATRKKVENQLLRSEEYFQSLIENAQDIITVLDQKGIIRYASPSIERLLGYYQGELVGRDVFQYAHENDRDTLNLLFEQLISSPEVAVTADFRFRHKDGHWVYLENIAKNVRESPDGPSIIVNSRDVSRRKRAVRTLEEHKVQLAEAQKIAKVGSWEWKPCSRNGEVLWSDEMARIFGVDPETFDNNYETYIQKIHPEDRQKLEDRIERALAEKKSFSVEHRIIRADGEEKTILCRGHVVTDEDGGGFKMIGTGQDITGQKEKEQRLREYSDRLRNLSERIERAREKERIRIARQVHDELGQMLTVLKMDVSMLKGQLKKNVTGEYRTYLKNQAGQIQNRINVIIKSVQQITTELRPEVLDDLGFREAIDWQANEFGKRTGMTVNFDSNFSDSSFLKDEKATTLFRIFQETLTNVIRHAGASHVDIELKKLDDKLFLITKDNGVGITEEQKEASSSMGIIGMRERTQFLNGDVKIEGKKGEGTTVILEVPLNGEQ